MNKKILTSLFACAALLPAVSASAGVVRFLPENGEAVKTAPLTTDTRITFGQGVTVTNGSETESMSWDAFSRLSFYVSTGLEGVVADPSAQIRLRENPVDNLLMVEGAFSDSPLGIYSVSGVCHLSLSHWRGESLDVSSLPAGLYILSIDNKTVKFFKK